MSDEALNAHLDWLDKCAKEQETDYETWLEGRVARAEGMLSIAMSENQRLTKHVEDYKEEIEELETQLSLSISMYEGDRSPMNNLQVENDTLKAKLTAIECAGCGKTMLECECDMESE